MFIKRYSYLIFVLTVLLFNQGCENHNAFSWVAPASTSADAEALRADADKALFEKKYEEAIILYDKVLDSYPDNSEALYGKAAAEIKNIGLDLSYIISAMTGDSGSSEDSNPLDVILGGLDMDNLAEGSASAAACLKEIADGKADGTIPADDADVNINLAIIMTFNAAAELLIKYNVNSIEDMEKLTVDNQDIDETTATLEDAKNYAAVALGSGSNIIGLFDDIIEGLKELKSP